MNELLDENELEQERRNRLRGWILYLIYACSPRPVDFSTLKSLLDRRNLPLTSHKLAKELSFLSKLELVEIWQIRKKHPNDDQDSLLNRYLESHNADDDYCVKICSKGIDFQEENLDTKIKGITRIG